MKVEFNEWDTGIYIALVPESKNEVLELLRYSNNAKMEKPSIFFSFGTNEPRLSVQLKKIAKSKQENYISKG